MTTNETPAQKATLVGGVIAFSIGIVLLLILAEITLRAVYPTWREFHSGRFMQPTHVEGATSVYTGKPDFSGYFAQNNGDFRVHLNINEFGLRNNEPLSAADGRIWVIGDSMTFGWGVEQDEMYSSIIAQTLGKPTYNVASPGTNVCGYHLLYQRMPKSLKPSVVVVGLILENDLKIYNCVETNKPVAIDLPDESTRNLIYYKQLLSEHMATYNFFVVAVKRVNIIREFLKMVGLIAPDHAYIRGFKENNLAQVSKSTVAALAQLKDLTPTGTPFVVVLSPSRFELRDNDPAYKEIRLSLVRDISAEGMLVVDPYADFKKAGFVPTHFAHDGHWSKLGHKIAGDAVAKALSRTMR